MAAAKQKPAPAKQETKSAQASKPTEASNSSVQAAGDKTLIKTQLYINLIKPSVSVADVKALYPNATNVRLKKRKVGLNRDVVQ